MVQWLMPWALDPSCLGSYAHSIICCVTLGNLLSLCALVCSSVHGDNSGTYLPGLLGEFHEAKHLKQGLADCSYACSEHRITYKLVKSLCGTPETHITLCGNLTSIKRTKIKNKPELGI